MKKIVTLFLILVCCLSCKKESQKLVQITGKQADTIILGMSESGVKTKTIYYPSMKVDSFNLRAYYEDGVLKDSCYISKSGYVFGKRYSFKEDGVVLIHEYLFDNTLNQYWAVRGSDTLNNYGNHYTIRSEDTANLNQKFQVEILLRKAYRDDFNSLFFVYPRKGEENQLKDDFSNFREIEYDTIRSLSDDEIPNNEFYDSYWSKRAILFRTGFSKKGLNKVKGILVERKDSLFQDKNDKQKKFIERYLFVSKDIYVN
jgi:hypothetical protein